jgi:hypothetical protein
MVMGLKVKELVDKVSLKDLIKAELAEFSE